MIRVGFGYDSHVFAPESAGRRFVLGGVAFEGVPGLAGHSDADALAHAVTDAVFGAVADGDIGSHFPDSDERWRGADSIRLLAAAAAEVRALGWRVVNADATVICERVRVRPYADRMRARLAEALGVGIGAVSVKGKTNEGMDAVGAGRGLEVHCAVLVEGPGREDGK